MKQKRTTLDQTAHLKPLFMIRKDDSQKKLYHDFGLQHKVDVLEYDGSNIYGAAQTYDMIIDECIQNGLEKVIILDDDLKFTTHNPIIGAKPDFKLCTHYEVETLFSHALNLVSEEMPMLSFTPIMTRSHDFLLNFCKPMMMAYVYYLPHFKDYPEHRFWKGKEIEARCDLNLSLIMLQSGFLNAFLNTIFIPDNVNNPGGCSTYRDLECEKTSVEYLKRNFSNVVSTRIKKGWIGDENVEREAPMIQWRKAFNRNAFKERFMVEAEDFARKMVSDYEITYSKFITELRNA